MKNKLHIFGCSHSAFDKKFIFDRIELSSDVKFWAEHIADHFELDLFERMGHAGRNVEYILFDIFDRILNNHIQKNDLIILNTSYPLRFGTPRLQSYSKHPLDNWDELKKNVKLSFDTIESMDELNPEITFILWYIQTFGAWKMLSSICDNVYQWCLHHTSTMDDLYLNALKGFYSNDTSEIFMNSLGIDKFNSILQTNNLNHWNNNITLPNKLESWDDWIQSHPIDKQDTHLHPNYYKTFADVFIKQIKYKND